MAKLELFGAARCPLAPGQRRVPVLVEDGRVIQIGWQGHGCTVGAE
jgi:glutaredoxin 3